MALAEQHAVVQEVSVSAFMDPFFFKSQVVRRASFASLRAGEPKRRRRQRCDRCRSPCAFIYKGYFTPWSSSKVKRLRCMS